MPVYLGIVPHFGRKPDFLPQKNVFWSTITIPKTPKIVAASFAIRRGVPCGKSLTMVTATVNRADLQMRKMVRVNTIKYNWIRCTRELLCSPQGVAMLRHIEQHSGPLSSRPLIMPSKCLTLTKLTRLAVRRFCKVDNEEDDLGQKCN